MATHIPFPETRSYVGSVLEVRGRYRQEYRKGAGTVIHERGWAGPA